MKNITIIVLLAIGTFLSSCTNTQEKSSSAIKTVSVSEFENLIKENKGILVDVRTSGEFQKGHIEGAKMITIDDDFVKNIETINKEEPILVYCRSGHRSMKAAKILESKGFTTIYNLDGGFKSWSSKH